MLNQKSRLWEWLPESTSTNMKALKKKKSTEMLWNASLSVLLRSENLMVRAFEAIESSDKSHILVNVLNVSSLVKGAMDQKDQDGL